MMQLERELSARAERSGLSPDLLRAVYLRETGENSAGGTQLRDAALARVDRFIAYATKQTQASCADRDLAPAHASASLTASAPVRPVDVGASVQTEYGQGLVVKIDAQAAVVRVQDSIYSVRFSELTPLAY